MPKPGEPRYKAVPWSEEYRVGTDGSVWSRYVNQMGKKDLGSAWRRLKTNHKRPMVVLCKDGRKHTWLVSRLVLTTFIGPCPPGKKEACHKNDVPTDNRLINLYWGTHLENMGDRDRNGRTSKGDRHGMSKLSDAEARFIKAYMSKNKGVYGAMIGLARRFNVHYCTIWEVVTGRRVGGRT